MGLQPEDDGTFVWPPMHWGSLGASMPDIAPPIVEEAAPPVPVEPPIEMAGAVTPDAQPTSYEPELTPGVEIPPAELQPGLSIPSLYVEQAAQPVQVPGPQPEPLDFDPLAPQSWDNTIGKEDLHSMAQRDPVAFAEYSMAHDAARAAEQRSQEALIARKNAEQEEQNYADLRASQAAADKAREEVANSRIDAGRWRESRTVPQSIAAMLSVVIGGLYQARKGGPNIGLEIINKAIDQDIAEQEANLANKRGALAEMREAGMSRFQSQQMYRAAVYARAKEDLLSKMQDFDPRGTTALNGAKQAYQFDMQIAQAAEVARQQKLKEGMALAKERREQEENARQWIETQDKHNAAQKKLMGGGAGAPKTGTIPTADVQAMLPPDAPRLPDRPEGYTPAQAKAHVDLYKSSREARGLDTKEQREAAAEVRELGLGAPSGESLVNKDGQPFKARDKTVAEKLAKQMNAASEVSDIIDEILAIRDRSGGESKIFNSDDRMRLDALGAQLVILQKSGTEGMSSDEDMKKLAAAVGADDVASFRSRAAGLEKGRERTVGFLNSTLRRAQYTGEPIKIPNRFNLPKPKPKLTDELLDRAMKTEYTPTTGLATAAANATPAAQQINSAYETDVKGLAAQAEFAPDEQDKRAARAALENLAQKHPTEAGRALAAEAVKQLPGTAPVRER